MSRMSCRHAPWAANMVVRCQVWHTIIYIVRHTQLDNDEHDMQSSPLDCTHSGMTSSVTCHHCPWTTYTVELLRAWHAIIALGQHRQGHTTWGVACHHRPIGKYTRPKTVRCGILSSPLKCTHILIMLGVAMLSLPLGSTHGRTTYDV